MRLLRYSNTEELSFSKNFVGKDTVPPYAILSHTWGADVEEVTFEDLSKGTGKDKPGYEKIWFCGEQAKQDDLEYFWVDTCCINKADFTELSEAINSMFRWYRNAARCYVYLSDVSSPVFDTKEESHPRPWESDFRKSRWFTRGWTLQELLAPSSVEFFSQEYKRLGDKTSLKQQIHEITGITDSALQEAALSQFSIDERFSWAEHRLTKLGEDKAYSLLGIFEIYMPLIYGEGEENAFKRLRAEFQKMKEADRECIQHLRPTDPYDDKKRIEETKGGLLEDSYHWILENSNFQQWRHDQQTRLLWIKGDPGKGKTMLLCGIINELKKSIAKTDLLSFFFCQAPDSRINNAIAVLRGLLYLLFNQQPSLIFHLRKKYDHVGKTLFEDANAWVALSEIFTNVLQDPSLNSTYLIIDALDECTTDLPQLLDFIAQKSCVSHVKWIVSSRNWPNIEERLERAGYKVRLCLELNAESISTAVRIYIRYKTLQLAKLKKYDDKTQVAVLQHLASNANDTFLWVALVCQNLEKIPRWKTLAKLNAFPPGLDSLYQRMMEQICNSDNVDLCKQILALTTVVYRPMKLKELTSLVKMLEDMSDDLESLQEIISLCGSFLIIREETIYFIHQSAKDYLLRNASDKIFPFGIGEAHYIVFSRSIYIMSKKLRRNIYNLHTLGNPIKQVLQPYSDPLAALQYLCIYWIDHLCDCNSNSYGNHMNNLQGGDMVDVFIRKKYLYWLEALSFCKSVSKGVFSMAKLEALIQGRSDACALTELVYDARRFILYHKRAIEISPLQTYTSALMFSPARSLIRSLFKNEEPKWITILPAMENKWSACLQTLEGHRRSVHSVAFSHDSTRLASGSSDKTVKIWDAGSGECLQTLKSHSELRSVAFSHNSARLASGSFDRMVKIWDASSGECMQTLEGHRDRVNLVAFSHDSTKILSASDDNTAKIWDVSSGECLQTLKYHRNRIKSVAFSHDLTQLAWASDNDPAKISDASDNECLQTLQSHSDLVNSVKIWDVSSDEYLQTLESHNNLVNSIEIWNVSSGKCLQTLNHHSVYSIVFSHNSTRLASGSFDATVKIWDVSSGECLQTLEGHRDSIDSVVFSHDSTKLASASADYTVKIWDVSSGECLQALEGHRHMVWSVAFSHDSTQLASGSYDGTVKIWDANNGECLQMSEGHRGSVDSVALSHDSTRLASASIDGTVKIWDVSSGECLQTLEDSRYSLEEFALVAFSPDSTRLASAAADYTVKIWDAISGECLQTLEGHRDSIDSVAFTPNTTKLASASYDNTVKIWDASSGKCLQTLEGHRDRVSSVAFSPDSTQLASGSYDSTVKIWDASSGMCLQMLEGHRSSVGSVAFTPNTTKLASASYDNTVKIWDASSGKCLKTLEGHRDPVFNVSFDSTGSYLHTEKGTIAIDGSSASNVTPRVTDSQEPLYQGAGLALTRAWITYNSKDLVWLPSEYRPKCSAISGTTIAVGVGSGKVWICDLKVDNAGTKETTASEDVQSFAGLLTNMF